MCILNLNGDFQQVNPAFEKILSYTPDQLLSQPFLDLFILKTKRQPNLYGRSWGTRPKTLR
jgi:PAS domain S-box-containing protein